MASEIGRSLHSLPRGGRDFGVYFLIWELEFLSEKNNLSFPRVINGMLLLGK
jgi:hypothetical protein